MATVDGKTIRIDGQSKRDAWTIVINCGLLVAAFWVGSRVQQSASAVEGLDGAVTALRDAVQMVQQDHELRLRRVEQAVISLEEIVRQQQRSTP